MATQEEINTKFNAFKGQVGGAEANGMITQDGTTAINSTTIAPETPIKLPEVNPTSSAESLSSTARAVAETQKQLQAKADAAAIEKEKNKLDLTSIQDEILGIQKSRVGAEKAAGLDVKAQAYTDATNKIEASQRAQVNEIRRLEQAEGTGMSTQGKIEAIAAINRKYAFEQADYALIQSAANRDYATAQNIVDRKIELQLEPLKTKLEFSKLFYEENKDTFDKADDRAFQNLIKTQERELKREDDRISTLEKTRLEAIRNATEQEAPESVLSAIRSADTSEDVITSAGTYGVGIREKLERKKLVAEIKTKSGTSVSETNPAINAISTLSYTLPENARVALVSSMSNAIQRGDVGGIDRILRNTAKNFAGSALATDITKRDIAIEAVRDLKESIVKYKEAGGDTGWLKGGYEDLARKVGRSTDSKLAALQTKVTLAVASYRNAVSGAAFTEQEQKEYKATFPSKSNTFELNETIADTLIDTFDKNNAAFYTSYYGDTPTNIAKQAVYEKLLQDATPAQRAALEQK